MKSLVTVIALFASSLAIACPDLSGTFTCPADQASGSPEVVQKVSQTVENGVTVYQIETDGKTESIIADAQPRTETAPFLDDNNKEIGTSITTVTFTCVDPSLKYNADFKLELKDGQKFNATALGEVKINAAGDFENTFTQAMDGRSESSVQTCIRNE
ncbi:MAG: hypothetical protein ABL927_02790 [Bdellovibrionales bacterium]